MRYELLQIVGQSFCTYSWQNPLLKLCRMNACMFEFFIWTLEQIKYAKDGVCRWWSTKNNASEHVLSNTLASLKLQSLHANSQKEYIEAGIFASFKTIWYWVHSSLQRVVGRSCAILSKTGSKIPCFLFDRVFQSQRQLAVVGSGYENDLL